jgi:glutamine cyclotransferase
MAMPALAASLCMTTANVVTTALPTSKAAAATAPEYGYRVVKVYPHDQSAFTQGLEFRAGALYESTGQYGQSKVRKVKLETGEVLQQISVSPNYFGEGITILNNKIVHLTWQSQVGFVYDQASLKTLRKFTYPGEGWGLANDGSRLYMSDGTTQIRVWDPVSFEEQHRLTVHDGARRVPSLNELEFVRGEILANVWMTDTIARISPKDGRVVGWINLGGLLTKAEQDQVMVAGGVMNGIAYDAQGDRLFVTGKLWPKLFEIKIVPRSSQPGPSGAR